MYETFLALAVAHSVLEFLVAKGILQSCESIFRALIDFIFLALSRVK